jgi:hypothetical protein
MTDRRDDDMLNLAAIGLIGVLLIGATLLVFYIAIKGNRVGAEVYSGFVGGVAVPRTFRLWTLLNVQLPIAFLTATFAALVALTYLEIARTVDHQNVEFLSNTCAFYFVGISALYVLAGVMALVNIVSGRAKKAIYRTSST